MMFYMNSKTFRDDFLKNETDKNILKAQYVLVSSRIRKREHHDNIVVAQILFPDSRVCSAVVEEDYRERYFAQLDDNEAFIASLVLGSIDENYNIIFLCSKIEDKLKYLKLLSEYIYLNFNYPVYEYGLYWSGASRLIKYNKKKIIKHCKSILKEVKKNKEEEIKGYSDRYRQTLQNMSKKELKKKCIKMDVYEDDMTKKEMIETIIDFR